MSEIKTLKASQEPFSDAQALASQHPETFSCPSMQELTTLKVSDYVKVCTGNERFWTKLEDLCEDGGLIGRVENDLVNQELHGLSYGDLIKFYPNNVYSILEP